AAGVTTIPRAYSGMGTSSSQRQACAYGWPIDRTEPANATTLNQGCWSSKEMNRWPTDPVAPSTATGICCIITPIFWSTKNTKVHEFLLVFLRALRGFYFTINSCNALTASSVSAAATTMLMETSDEP